MAELKALRRILIIDTEGRDEPTEIGAILYSFDHGIEKEYWSLIPFDIQKLNEMIGKCDAIMAHNAGHDKGLLENLSDLNIDNKPWICTMYDFTWPEHRDARRAKLRILCDFYKVSLRDAHNALRDCHLLLQCLSQIPNFHFELEKALEKTTKRMQKLEKTVVTLLTPETHIVPYNNEPVVAKFLWTHGKVYQHMHGKYGQPINTIPVPHTIKVFATPPRNMVNARKLQNYINNGFPICAGHFRKSCYGAKGILFTIGEKKAEKDIIQASEHKNKVTFALVDSDMPLIEHGNGAIVEEFVFRYGKLNRCKLRKYAQDSGVIIPCPRTLKVFSKLTNIQNC